MVWLNAISGIWYCVSVMIIKKKASVKVEPSKVCHYDSSQWLCSETRLGLNVSFSISASGRRSPKLRFVYWCVKKCSLPPDDRRIWTIGTRSLKAQFSFAFHLSANRTWCFFGRINNACRCSTQRQADKGDWHVDRQACGKGREAGRKACRF